MYLVKLYKDHADEIGTTIHSPYINDLKLSDGVITYVLGAVHDFEFTTNINNPAWNRIEPLKTIIKITDVLQKKVIFEGRALQPRARMNSDGSFYKEIECESLLAYLNDSSQRHAEIHDTTIRDFLQIILDNHNRQVEPHKRMLLGDVTVTNTTDNVYRYLGYDNTYETIKDKLIDRMGGYLQVRREDDGLYLDYLEDIGEYIQSTPIRLSHNMQSINYEIDPTEVITRLVPLGASIESEDEGATDASQARLTIADVNNGVDYLDDLELQKEFGIVERQATWDDVTTPQRLLTNGLNFLRDQKAAITRFEVDSTNTHLLGKDIASFEIGNYHELINPIIDVNEKVQIIEKKIDINQPQKSSLKIGDKFRTLSQYQKASNKQGRVVLELQNIVDGQSKTISNIKKEISNVEVNLGDLQQAIENADLEDLPDAISALEQAINSLNDALDGIPIYGPATTTEDGLMTSADKIKLDGLEIYQEATELLSGLMSASDKRKLNRLTVTQSIDLDQLYQDVQNLKNNG